MSLIGPDLAVDSRGEPVEIDDFDVREFASFLDFHRDKHQSVSRV